MLHIAGYNNSACWHSLPSFVTNRRLFRTLFYHTMPNGTFYFLMFGRDYKKRLKFQDNRPEKLHLTQPLPSGVTASVNIPYNTEKTFIKSHLCISFVLLLSFWRICNASNLSNESNILCKLFLLKWLFPWLQMLSVPLKKGDLYKNTLPIDWLWFGSAGAGVKGVTILGKFYKNLGKKASTFFSNINEIRLLWFWLYNKVCCVIENTLNTQNRQTVSSNFMLFCESWCVTDSRKSLGKRRHFVYAFYEL